MRDALCLLTKPIVMVGGQVHAGPTGHTDKPSPASMDMYGALPQAAPLNLDECASILEGHWPFEFEEHDDRGALLSWNRVLQRLQEAVEAGALPRTPTLKELVSWANEIGLPIKNGDLLRAAVPGSELVPQKPSHQYPSRHDPEVQRMANDVAAEMTKTDRRRPKKTAIAQEVKRRSTGRISKLSVSTIERQFILHT